MGFPADGTESLYRNDMVDVQRFFDTRHRDHYKVSEGRARISRHGGAGMRDGQGLGSARQRFFSCLPAGFRSPHR